MSLRQVKHARQMLEDIGLFQRHDATAMGDEFATGQTITINLQWEGPPHDSQSARGETIRSASCCRLCWAVRAQQIVRAAQQVQKRPAEARIALPLQPPQHDTASDRTFTRRNCTPSQPCYRSIAPPDSYRELSPRRENQKPACGGAPGVLTALFHEARTAVREGRVPRAAAGPIVQRNVAVSRPPFPAFRPRNRPLELPQTETEEALAEHPLAPPTLRHILVHDLRDTERLLQLYEQAVNSGRDRPLGSRPVDLCGAGPARAGVPARQCRWTVHPAPPQTSVRLRHPRR